MKKLDIRLVLLGLLFLLPSLKAAAQDTTWVQTYTFDSLYTRRAKFFFPTANTDYRKILMYFNIKCYPSVSGDGNYACGEWDYIYFNSVYDHRGKLDSTLMTGRYFTVNGNGNIDTLNYSNMPQYNVYRSYLYNTVIDNTTSTASFILGGTGTAMPHPFNLAAKQERAQFIWKASELTAAGLTAGNITGVKLNFQNNAATLNNVVIRMRAISADSFTVTAMMNDSLKTVYNYNKTITVAGLNSFQFSSPFVWNGTSNILVDISFQNVNPAAANPLLGSNTTYPASLYSDTTNFAMGSFGSTGGNIRFPQSLNMFAGTAPRTYDLWMNVDSFIAPEGTLLSAGLRGTASADFTMRTTSPDNNYRLNLWGTNDATFAGPNTKKVWKHFAVTYASDTFKFYFNGSLAFTKYRPGLNTATAGDFFMGESRETGYFYLGKFSHLRIWDKALTGAEISNWVGRDITPAHPQYSHLKADYRINTGAVNTVQDQSPLTQAAGVISGNLWWQAVKAKDIYYNAQKLNWRPQMVFQRDVYTSHIDSTLVSDTVGLPPVLVKFYDNPDGNYIIQDTSSINPANYTSIGSAWINKYRYIYLNGVKVDSVLNTLNATLYNHDLLWYSNTVKYEIGRSISPYGIQLNLGNGRTRIHDLTDYYSILQDTVDLEIGGTQEIQDVKFAFIKGEPPAEVNRILQPWGKGWNQYQYSKIALDSVLQPKTITLAPNTDQVKFRSYISGHGGAENSGPSYPNGCCEFMFNTHFYKSNNQTVHSFKVRRTDCDLNPIYPQGGTWVYDREGWCPGDIIIGHDWNVTSNISNGQINLDYHISAIPSGGGNVGKGVYDIGLQVIEYKTPGRNNDAEVYDIRKPSDAFAVSRMNPICHTPQIILRNAGRNNLTSAVIKYKVSGGTEASFNWTGNLKFLDTTLVDLPISGTSFWNGDQSNRFIVYTAMPNGVADEYTGNDTSYSSFDMPDISPNRIIIKFKTNSRPSDNTLTIKNETGTTVFSKTGMAADSLYNDTLALPVGCYTFVLDDAGQNGLTWWAATSQGSGTISIANANTGADIKTFNSDFGAQLFYTFSVVDPLSIHSINFDNDVVLFPNPNKGDFSVQLQGFNGKVNLELVNILGQSVMKEEMSCLGSKVSKSFHTGLPAGIYMLQLSSGNNKAVKKIVIE